MDTFAVSKNDRPLPVFCRFFAAAVVALGLSVAARAEEALSVETAPLAGAAQPVETFTDPRLAEAATDLAAGKWADARDKAERVLGENKRSAEAWAVLGRSYYGEGRYRKAMRRLKKALKYDPHYAAAYFWKAKAFEAMGKLDEAANEYQAAFHADPRREDARSAYRNIRDRVAASDE